MQMWPELTAGDQIAGDRDYQEDAFQIARLRPSGTDELLLVIADGMGGHVGGARASDLAVTALVSHCQAAEGDIGQRLRQSLDAANAAIAGDVAANPQYASMGCTLVACLVTGDELHWLSVGDSPLWLLRQSQMTRLNADHSMRPVLHDLVDIGRMTAEELKNDHRVNQLRSALMGEDLTLVDQNEFAFSLAEGDRVILASDGLETLTVDEIGNICSEHSDPAEAVVALLDAIEKCQCAGQDNATAIVYAHSGLGSASAESDRVDAPPPVDAPDPSELDTVKPETAKSSAKRSKMRTMMQAVGSLFGKRR